jgi:hypothetical protein
LIPLAVFGAALAGAPSAPLAKQADVEEKPADSDGIEPEGGVGGYAVERVESEISIHVPEADVESVWQYLTRVYGKGSDEWPAGVDHRVLSARLSDESFVDHYFDTPGLSVLAAQNGVRWRIRDIPGAPDDPKDDRQLVQVKVTSGADTVTRGEYKFPVKKSVLEHGASGGPPAELIRDKYRKPFRKLVRAIGADPGRLDEVLRLYQRRRRVYFNDAKGPMMTITLDQVTARRWWARAPWNEMEVEIGEVRYTNASPAERTYMEGVRAAIRADLFAHFHTLYEDDLPKYGEGFTRLEKKLPFMRRAIAVRESVRPAAMAGLGVVALVGAGLLLARRRRGRAGGAGGAGGGRLVAKMA